MSTAQLILILAVLLLGGVIATVGDRLGTRIGKARLSLFKLRPRQTATLVTILTGTIISASTFGILFALSSELRRGVFEFENTQRKLRSTRTELDGTISQKTKIESELAKARSDQTAVKEQLTQTRAKAKAEAAKILSELNRTQGQLTSVSQQRTRLSSEIAQLQADRDRIIAQQNTAIKNKEQTIKDRNAVILEREKRLGELQAQQSYLGREIQRLELEAQGLREGKLAIQRGQVLASAVVRTADPTSAIRAVNQLLQEANRQAIQRVRPGSKDKIIQVLRTEVEEVINRIGNGQDYVVQVFAAGNYLIGETPIRVLFGAIRNQLVLNSGDVVASSSVDPSNFSSEQIQQWLNQLIAAADFRARNLGILGESVDIGRIQNVIAFVEQLKQTKQTVLIKAVAAEAIYTAGPLKIEFIAEKDGLILFRTRGQT
jgi:uncharacterized protein (DUF3084 family)